MKLDGESILLNPAELLQTKTSKIDIQITFFPSQLKSALMMKRESLYNIISIQHLYRINERNINFE